MTYNVFGGTLNLAQFNSIQFISFLLFCHLSVRKVCLAFTNYCLCVLFTCLYMYVYLFFYHERWTKMNIGRVSYIRISLCYFCFRWKTVSLVQASMQHLMHHVTVSLQQSKITLQNNWINNTSITQPTLSFYLWLKCRICNFHTNCYDYNRIAQHRKFTKYRVKLDLGEIFFIYWRTL